MKIGDFQKLFKLLQYTLPAFWKWNWKVLQEVGEVAFESSVLKGGLTARKAITRQARALG
jgi:hypothetical protein